LRQRLNERNVVNSRLLDDQFAALSASLFPSAGSAGVPDRQKRASIGVR
jgi:hypothetical protein